MKRLHSPRLMAAVFLASITSFPALAGDEKKLPPPAVPPYQSLTPDDQARMAWWIDARYGMFIHWGVASIKGVELSWDRKGPKPLDNNHPNGAVEAAEYDNLYKTWNPSEFNPKEWVKIAKVAGMKYMVLTAKHHDGFCLWDSKLTDYKITNTPFKRDVVKEFTDACHEAGMKVGIYYSPRDWHQPDYGVGDNRKYTDYMNGQLAELLGNYGPIDVIWFDSYGKADLEKFWHIDETWKLIKKLQPNAIINNRLTVLAQYNNQPKPYLGDFDTPEQTIGKMQTSRPWESCMCFVGNQWGYKPDGSMYGLDGLIRAIVSCASGDGNLLMNVGPMPTGQIEPRQAERLKEAGDWLAKYGFTIYGTRGGPWENARWGGATRRGNIIYLHVFDWKGRETLRLQPIPEKIVSHKVLTGGNATVTQNAKGVDISVPPSDRNQIDTIIELTLSAPSTEQIKGMPIRSIFDDGRSGNLISADAVVTASSSGRGDDPAKYPKLVASPGLDKGAAVITRDEDNSWISIDLGTVREVKGVSVQPVNVGERRLTNMVLSSSTDGTNWTQIWQCGPIDEVIDIPVTTLRAGAQVPGMKIRHLRFEGRLSNAGILLKNVRVFGE